MMASPRFHRAAAFGLALLTVLPTLALADLAADPPLAPGAAPAEQAARALADHAFLGSFQQLQGSPDAQALAALQPTLEGVLQFYARDRGLLLSPPLLPTPDGPSPLPDALLALGALLGAPVEAEQLEAAARLPPELQQALARIVLAYVQAARDTTAVLAGVTAADLAALARGEPAPSDVDGGKLASAALLVDRAVRESTPALRKWALLLAIEERTRHPSLGDVAPADLLKAGAATQTIADMVDFASVLQGWLPLDATFRPTSASPSAALERLYGLLGMPVFPDDRVALAVLDALPAPKRLLMVVMADGLAEAAARLLVANQLDRDGAQLRQAELLLGALDWEGLRLVDPAHFPARELQPVLDALERADRALQLRLEAASLMGDALAMAKTLVPHVAGLDGPQTQGVQTVEVPEGDPVNLPLPLVSCGVFFPRNTPTVSCGPVAYSGPALKANIDDGTLQVTLYADANDDNQSHENEVLLRSPPLADPSNDIVLKDPWGFLLVGGEGSTRYDERYGSTNVSLRIENGTVREERKIFREGRTGGLFAPIFAAGTERSDVNETVFEPQDNGFVNFTMNPMNRTLLIVDLGGNDVYTNQPAGVNRTLQLYNNSMPERMEKGVAGFSPRSLGVSGCLGGDPTGLSGDGGGGGEGGDGGLIPGPVLGLLGLAGGALGLLPVGPGLVFGVLGGFPFVLPGVVAGPCEDPDFPQPVDEGVVVYFFNVPNPADPDTFQGPGFEGGTAVFLNSTNMSVDVRLSVILDTSGDDDYNWTQRDVAFGAADRGVGILWDAERCDPDHAQPAPCQRYARGHDRYAGWNNTTGAAWHRAVGLFLDEQGDDTHQARNHSLGSATERGVGLAVDLAGRDTWFGGNYTMGHGGREELRTCEDGTQNDPQPPCLYERGIASEQLMLLVFTDIGSRKSPYATTKAGLGLLLDRRGDDAYGQVNGTSNQGKGWPALGMLLDLGGTDQGLQTSIDTDSQFGPIAIGLQDNGLVGSSYPILGQATPFNNISGTAEMLAEGRGGGIVIDAELDEALAPPGVDGATERGFALRATEVNGELPPMMCAGPSAAQFSQTIGLPAVITEVPVQANPFEAIYGSYEFGGGGCNQTEDLNHGWRAFSRQPLLIRIPGAFGLGGTLSNDGREAAVADEEHLLHIDLDGNDLYRGPFGGAALPDLAALDTRGRDDKGNGTVDYGPVLRPGVVAPVALAVDVDGADTYDARSGFLGRNATTGEVLRPPVGIPTLGGGYMGVGLLYDLGQAGNATFPGLAAREAFPGTCAGAGVQDAYLGSNRTMGYGAAFGVGALVDVEGDDCYEALSLPTRDVPDASTVLGSAVVESRWGNFTVADVGHAIAGSTIPDGTSIAAVLSNTTAVLNRTASATKDRVVLTVAGDDARALGVGHFGGLGVLLDARGNDTYRSGTLSQGAGIVQAVNDRLPHRAGLLLRYPGGLATGSVTLHDPCVGGGAGQGELCRDEIGQPAQAFGAFVDGRGHDRYSYGGDSAQGYGAAVAARRPGHVQPPRVLAGLFVDDGFDADLYEVLPADPAGEATALATPDAPHQDDAVWCSEPKEGHALDSVNLQRGAVHAHGNLTYLNASNGGTTQNVTLLPAVLAGLEGASAATNASQPALAARWLNGTAHGTNQAAACLEVRVAVGDTNAAARLEVGSLGRGYDNLDFFANFVLAAGTFGEEYVRARSVLSAPAVVDVALCPADPLAGCNAAARVAAGDVRVQARVLWGPSSMAYNALQLFRHVCTRAAGSEVACEALVDGPLRLNLTGDRLQGVPGQDATDLLNLTEHGGPGGLGNALGRVTVAARPVGALPAQDPCRAGQRGGEVPLGVYDRDAGPGCASLLADEAGLLAGVRVGDGLVELPWATDHVVRTAASARRYVQDGPYDLVVRASFQPGATGADVPSEDERYVRERLGDAYGFYPGVGMLRVAVDNAPLVTGLDYLDLSFAEDPDPTDEVAPNRELAVDLTAEPLLVLTDADRLAGVEPEPALNVIFEVVPLDAAGEGVEPEHRQCGEPAYERTIATTCTDPVRPFAPVGMRFGWQPGLFTLPDGRYALKVTLREAAHGRDGGIYDAVGGRFPSRTAEACFFARGGILAQAELDGGACRVPLWVDSSPPRTQAQLDGGIEIPVQAAEEGAGPVATVQLAVFDGPLAKDRATLRCQGNSLGLLAMPEALGNLVLMPPDGRCVLITVDRLGVKEHLVLGAGGTPDAAAELVFYPVVAETGCAGPPVARLLLPPPPTPAGRSYPDDAALPLFGEARCLLLRTIAGAPSVPDTVVSLETFAPGHRALGRAASYAGLRLEFFAGGLGSEHGVLACDGTLVGRAGLPAQLGDALPAQGAARCARVVVYDHDAPSDDRVATSFDVGLPAAEDAAAALALFRDPACEGEPAWSLAFPSGPRDQLPPALGTTLDPHGPATAACLRATARAGGLELLNRTVAGLEERALHEPVVDPETGDVVAGGSPAKVPLRFLAADAEGSPLRGYQVRYHLRVLRDLPMGDPLPRCMPLPTCAALATDAAWLDPAQDRAALRVPICPPGVPDLGCVERVPGEEHRSAWPVHVDVEVRARDWANNVEQFHLGGWEDVGILDLDPPVADLCGSLRPQSTGDPAIPRRRSSVTVIPLAWDPALRGCSTDRPPFDNVGVAAVDVLYNVTAPLVSLTASNLTASGRVWTPGAAEQAALQARFDTAVRTPGEVVNNRTIHFLARARDLAGNLQEDFPDPAKVIHDTQGPAMDLLNVSTTHASLDITWFAKDREAEGRIARSWLVWGPVDPVTGEADLRYETNATQVGPRASLRLPDPANTTTLDGSPVPAALGASNLYALEARSLDDVGNPSVLPLQRFATDSPVQLQVDQPRPGDTLTGAAKLVLNISGVRVDPLVHYNVSLVLAAGDATLSLPVENFTRRECLPPEDACPTPDRVTQAVRTIASARFPDSTEAFLVVRAENALNPGRPTVVSVGPLRIDNTPPATRLAVDAPGGPEWFRASAVARLVPEDAVSDVARVEYSLDNFTFQDYNASAPPVFDREGSFPIFFRATDAAGNAEPLQIRTVGVDRQRPQGSLLVNRGAGATSDRNVTLTLLLQDSLAGVANVTVDAGAGAEALEGPSRFAVPRDLPFRLPAQEGDHRVRVRALDRAGNLLELKAAVTLDTTPPAIGAVEVDRVGHTTATLRWRTSEPSGTRVDYGPQGSQVLANRFQGEALERTHTVVLQGLRPSKVYEARVVADDALGNRATARATFETLPDVAAPGPVRDLAAEDLRNGVVRLAWGAAHDDVGIDHYVVYRGVAGQLEELARVPEDLFLDDTGLAGTTYEYAVRAIDLAGHEGPLSAAVRGRPSTRPQLVEPHVTPDRGTATQVFTYSVVVVDRDGDAPLAVEVHIGDRTFELQPQFEGRADFARGVRYQLSLPLPPTTLSGGFPTYQFEAQDALGAVRAPAVPAAGPAVLGSGALLPGLTGAQGILGLPGLGLAGLAAAAALAVVVARRRRGSP